MPIYDYQCAKCGHRFDQLVKLDARPPKCPSCGSRTERISSFSAVVSTRRTREKALKVGRAMASSQKKEKDRAHEVYLQNHIKDHS